MKISVVIPAYNEEKYIPLCLESLQKQSLKPYEIVVVDNNSIDHTAEIAEKYGARVVKESIQGMIPARNRGYSEAQGDIIARCDADCILPTNWIQKIHDNFSNHTIDALSGPFSYYENPAPSPVMRVYTHVDLLFDFMKIVQFGKETLIGPNTALTKNIWNKVREEVCLDDKKVHEDLDLAIHIIHNGGHIHRDNTFTDQASARRVGHSLYSSLIDYPWRLITTVFHKYALDLKG